MMTKLNSGQKHFLRLNDARLLLEQATDEIEVQERRVTLAVAAERERWAAPVRALLAAHDAALERVGKMMQANGMMTLNLPAEVNDEFKAVHALRDVLRA